VNGNTSVATLWCRSEYLVRGRQGWSSSILERKLTAHTTAISSSRRVCCLTSEQYFVITGGHCSRMERQRTQPGQRWTIRKKSTSTSLNLTCGLQIALILIPFGVLFSNESTTNDNSRRRKNWSERQSPSGNNYHSVSLITVSMNGVDELKLLSRMAADTSSIATWLKQPHIILILSKYMFSQ